VIVRWACTYIGNVHSGMIGVATIAVAIVLCAAVPALGSDEGLALPMLPFSEIPNSNVTEIATFEDAVRVARADDETFVILFYDPLDINSIRMAPVWDRTALSLKGFATVAAISVRAPELLWLINAWEIRNVPAIRLASAKPGRRKDSDSLLGQVAGVKNTVLYQEGGVNPDQIKKWTLNQLFSDYVTKVSKVDALEEIVATSDLPVSVLFTEKDATAALYKALSITFHGRMHFVEVSKSAGADVHKKYNVKKLPHLVVFKAGGGAEPTAYKGSLNVETISEFFTEFVMTREARTALKLKEDQDLIAKAKLRAEFPVSQIATPKEWAEDVLRKPVGVACVAFLDPSSPDFKARVETLTALAKAKAKTSVNFYTWVDSRYNNELVEHFGSSPDSIVFISGKKNLYTRFVGTFSDKGITAFATTNLARGVGAKVMDPTKLPKFVETPADAPKEEL
jgi:hypothetical protein